MIKSLRTGPLALRLAVVLTASAMLVAGCGGGEQPGGGGSTQTSGVTITVALASDPPPKAALAEFTKETGIKVKWVNIDWDSLQTKISAAATANTYFADATDVDWSRVGQLGKLGWFYPMDDYLDTKSMEADMPAARLVHQRRPSRRHPVRRVVHGHHGQQGAVREGGRERRCRQPWTTTPPRCGQMKAKGVVEVPAQHPVRRGRGPVDLLVRDHPRLRRNRARTRASRSSPPRTRPATRPPQWMVDALKSGLVPPGNINVTDSQGQQTLMAKGQVASTFSDYSGTVGTMYNVPSSSSVVSKVTLPQDPGCDRRRRQPLQPRRNRHPEGGEVPARPPPSSSSGSPTRSSRSTSPGSTARRRRSPATRSRRTSPRSSR